MDLVATIREAWGWAGISPVRVVGDNSFGNLMIEDDEGRYWRLCPEDLACSIVAQDRSALKALSQQQEFLHDWYMAELEAQARSALGLLRPGYKYSLKLAAPLGGEYSMSNLAAVPLLDLISFSGHLARQTAALADGVRVSLVVTE